MMGGFLDYVPGSSLLHRLNPLTKMLVAVALCAACFVSAKHLFVLGVLVISLILAYSAGIFRRAFRMVTALIKFSLLLFVVQVLVIRTETRCYTIPPGLQITDEGVLFSLLFVLRMIAATLPLAIMLSVTQISDLSGMLVEKLRVPYKYVFALTTLHALHPDLHGGGRGHHGGADLAGVDFDTRNLFRKIALILPLCVPLLISSVERIDRGAISAELRGFSQRVRGASYKAYRMRWIDWGAIALCAALIALAAVL
jgi:energy-coupling factor transport system permease protein